MNATTATATTSLDSSPVDDRSTEITFLNTNALDAINAQEFQAIKPFPFLEIKDILTRDGHQALIRGLPDPTTFSQVFGRRRRYGQRSHDRFVLQYHPLKAIPELWRDFIRELNGEPYRQFAARLLGRDDFLLHCHWHYTPRGCSVSPHCDTEWKLGAHIFYLNTASDWDPAWGGETIALGGKQGLDPRSAPEFDDFPVQIASHPLGNRSLIFRRDAESWHGVRPLQCPLGALRKVFIVEFRRASLVSRLRTALGF
jgi:2OG-Fe(II) oxygenase superfamily